MLKESEKSEHFYVTHEHFKKNGIILALFWQKATFALSINYFNAFFYEHYR